MPAVIIYDQHLSGPEKPGDLLSALFEYGNDSKDIQRMRPLPVLPKLIVDGLFEAGQMTPAHGTILNDLITFRLR